MDRVLRVIRRSTRRRFVQQTAAGLASLPLQRGAAAPGGFRSAWPTGVERPWPGPDYWSNPLQDWRIRDGRLECFVAGGDRNVFLLTREVAPGPGDLELSVTLGRLEDDGAPLQEGFAGFRLGIRGYFHDYRDSAVHGVGLNAGITTGGALFIGRREGRAPVVSALQNVRLTLRAETRGARCRITLRASDAAGATLAETARDDLEADWLTGGLALVSSSGAVADTPSHLPPLTDYNWQGKPGLQRGGTWRLWFRDWQISGSKLVEHPERRFGPIMFAMHTVSRGVLKLTAQLAPLGAGRHEATLEVRNGRWRVAATAAVDTLSWTATFHVDPWDSARSVRYRVRYGDDWFEGTIRRDPAPRGRLTVAAFTCNNDLGFPHADVSRHVARHKPDIALFTGDQIYERVAGYGTQREPLAAAALDYLRKWYLFGWAYRDLLRDVPAVCMPDDHDVYHGNIWGAGGRRARGPGQPGQDSGGYTMPVEWVNMVQRTQTSHLPDPFDPTPAEQGVTVYYCELEYGGVSFAILEDRKWKSAPGEFLPGAEIRNGWAQNPAYRAADHGDALGAQLLGRRQMDFLHRWAERRERGVWMKLAVSGTLFANVATMPKGVKGDEITPKLPILPPGEYAGGEAPVADHDSNGWPQGARNEALRALRRAGALHVCGDQHLGSTVQYGIDDWDDGPWAICVPAISNIWPRRWFPPEPGRNRRPGSPRNTGEYLDGFGNRVTVHAVANPSRVPLEPIVLTHRATGYGIIHLDRRAGRITLANWPRWVDPAGPGARPYAGWPITLSLPPPGKPGVRLA
jgi:hypothetical protein